MRADQQPYTHTWHFTKHIRTKNESTSWNYVSTTRLYNFKKPVNLVVTQKYQVGSTKPHSKDYIHITFHSSVRLLYSAPRGVNNSYEYRSKMKITYFFSRKGFPPLLFKAFDHQIWNLDLFFHVLFCSGLFLTSNFRCDGFHNQNRDKNIRCFSCRAKKRTTTKDFC